LIHLVLPILALDLLQAIDTQAVIIKDFGQTANLQEWQNSSGCFGQYFSRKIVNTVPETDGAATLQHSPIIHLNRHQQHLYGRWFANGTTAAFRGQNAVYILLPMLRCRRHCNC
jgi:hypothetical protein